MQYEFHALNAHLAELSLGLPIDKEGRGLTPPQDSLWLSVRFYASGDDALAIKGSVDVTGFYQIEVNAPNLTGVAQLFDVVSQIKSHFRPATQVKNQYGSVELRRITIDTSPTDVYTGRIIRVYWRNFN